MRLKHLLKTTAQLGFTQVALFALYKIGLKTGYYKRTPIADSQISNIEYLFTLPSRTKLKEILGSGGIKTLLANADHIADGYFRIFGGELAEIKLDFNHPLAHWTDYETGKAAIPDSRFPTSALNLPPSTFDLKLIWEPARFGWAFTLGRAYRVSGDEKYAQAFWRYFEIFDAGNPVNLGPNWMNGQEVAIRLMAFVWAGQVFSDSAEATNQRKGRLAESVAEHASRIPPTLLYARAQNNNHLLSEAVGLYTAALALPSHPQAEKWRKLGIKWLTWSFENQIDEKGEYIQRSVTYHRLMLQLALWVNALSTKGHEVHEEKNKKIRKPFCPLCLKNLTLATRWLADLTDPISGNAPNLGANDGAYLFPLANGAIRDFRPVVSAAAHAFLGETVCAAGAWDEMALWFEDLNVKKLESLKPSNLPTSQPPNLPTSQPSNLSTSQPSNLPTSQPSNLSTSQPSNLPTSQPSNLPTSQPSNLPTSQPSNLPTSQPSNLPTFQPSNIETLKPSPDTWASLRVADGNLRLAHADQLHFDLWWMGENITLDPGTYLYNGESPWDNPFTATKSHNTVTVNDLNQMTRAGKFMYLDWSSGRVVEKSDSRIVAEHDGYKKLGILHRRSVSFEPNTWLIEDNLQTFKSSNIQTYCIHWLLPDWEWELENREKRIEISLKSRYGVIKITQYAPRNTQAEFSLARAGQLLHGTVEVTPTRGWYSPTYGVKIPALSLALEVTAKSEVEFITEIQLPN